VRAHGAADEDGAARTPARDLVDAQADEPVVDEDVVAGLQHLADDRGRDGQLAVRRELFRADDDVLPAHEEPRLRQVADAELRALEVGDERDRAADLRRDLAHEPRALRMLLVRAVREVQPHRVDARADEVVEPVGRRRGRSERRDDLRSALLDHAAQST
jgi:hypothetical protein